MDHWWIEASGIAERFTALDPAQYYGVPAQDTFQLELRTGDDRAMRINGHRNLLKRARRQMATDRDMREFGTQIAHTMRDVTGADLSVHEMHFGPGSIFGEEATKAGTFWLALETHDARTIRIEGDRTLFLRAPWLVTDEDVRQLGQQIVSTINTVTGEMEGPIMGQ
jgi:hypothetical protein